MSNIISNQNIDDDVYIDSKYINKNINKIIFNKIVDMYGDKCHSMGYIIKKSISIIDKSIGIIKTINSKSMVLYKIKLNCDIILPRLNDKINCIVEKINKAGMVCYYKYSQYSSIEYTPIIIIVPYTNDINKYSVGDNIDIVVKSIRIKHNSDKIQVVGELV